MRYFLFFLLSFMLFAEPEDFYYHHIQEINSKFSEVVLEDGSVWKIHPHYRCLVKDWKVGDILCISPNHCCETPPFDFTNLRLKNYAAISLLSPPGKNNVYTCYLAYSDPEKGKLAIWTQGALYLYVVDKKDQEILQKWTVGDPMIIGTNEWLFSTLFSTCHTILINPKFNHFIRVQLE